MGATESKNGKEEEAVPVKVNTAPPLVKLGDTKRRWEENPVPPIRLEDVVPPEERVQAPSALAEDTSSSSRGNLWQIYALGTFMIARWAYGRWKEGKDKGGNDVSPRDD